MIKKITGITIISLFLMLQNFITSAQTVDYTYFDNGGSGAYKALAAQDSTLEGFTIIRPVNLETATSNEGGLPVVLFANGGCANNNLIFDGYLTEIASHGYLVIAIGPLDKSDMYQSWENRLRMGNDGPKSRPAVLGNGTIINTHEVNESDEQQSAAISPEEIEKMREERANQPQQQTSGKQLLEALDWISQENADATSEYYHAANLGKVAVMGQSCGGAQALSVSYDPRVSTSVILNSGIGDMQMADADKSSLNELHAPIVYIIGGEEDVAYPNAEKDYAAIENVPVAKANLTVGHLGTYYEKCGGDFAVVSLKWLDWQLKNRYWKSAFFLDEKYGELNPDWSVESKNF